MRCADRSAAPISPCCRASPVSIRLGHLANSADAWVAPRRRSGLQRRLRIVLVQMERHGDSAPTASSAPGLHAPVRGHGLSLVPRSGCSASGQRVAVHLALDPGARTARRGHLARYSVRTAWPEALSGGAATVGPTFKSTTTASRGSDHRLHPGAEQAGRVVQRLSRSRPTG